MGNLTSYYTQIIFLTFIIINHLWEIYLARRQSHFLHLNRHEVPSVFSSTISMEDHQKSILYSTDRLRLSQARLIYQLVLYLYWFPFRGAENLYTKTSDLSLTGDIFFLLSFLLIQSLLSLPFSYISTFVIEKKYGFNRTTVKLFFLDFLKGLILTLLILGPLLFIILKAMSVFKQSWWFISFVILTLFQFIMLWLYPVVIAPLFNKFTLLENEELKNKIEKLLSDVGLKSQGIYVMDASKRSTHGNAYFTGFGKAKRVVFYDTLLDKLSNDEIIAVLAHELGHLKLKHIPKQIAVSTVLSFAALFLMYLLSKTSWFYSGHYMRIITNGTLLFIFSYAMSIYSFWFGPLFSLLSRKNEFEADAFAATYSSASDLKNALLKLYKFNSSPIVSDRVYAFFYYSHPSPIERFKRL